MRIYGHFICNLQIWCSHLRKLSFINEQLRSPVAVNIIMNLEDANSAYGQSFHLVKKELTKVCIMQCVAIAIIPKFCSWKKVRKNVVKLVEMI